MGQPLQVHDEAEKVWIPDMQEQSIDFSYRHGPWSKKHKDSKGATHQSISKIVSEEQTSDGHLGGNSPAYLLLEVITISL